MRTRMVKCSDVGIRDCNFIAIGNDIDEVEQIMLEHIESEHKDLLSDMDEHEVHLLKHRISTFLGRSCGCGHLPGP